MAFRSRIAGLVATAAMALPATALIAALPGTAAQAAVPGPAAPAQMPAAAPQVPSVCGSEQAAIFFHNGSVHCQDFGRVTYIALKDNERIRQICAGEFTLAEVFPYGLVTRPVLPGKCELLAGYPLSTDVTVAALGF